MGAGAPPSLLRLFALAVAIAAAAEDVSTSSPKNRKHAMTLAFVFDSTMSMDSELEQIKQAMQDIFDYMKVNRPEIVNYALVDFNDPDARLISITNDSNVYRESLNTIEIDGGDDCPEMAIEGIKIALEESLPNSYIFVFTDASAKDYKNESIVQNLIQEKKSKVIFVLTNTCKDDEDGDKSEKSEFALGYEVYKKIAHNSNGYVFDLKKSEVKEVLEFIKLNTGRKEILCVDDVKDDKETACIAPVDETSGNLTITVAGDHPKILLQDPSGIKVTGNETVHLKSVLSTIVEKPKFGNWKIKVRVHSSGRFMVTVDSSFSIIYGFSTNSTEEMIETTSRPIAGEKNTILIQTVNLTDSIHLLDVKLKDSEYNVLKSMSLNPVSSKYGTYKTEMFQPPNSTFFLEVTGRDSKNNSVTRISESSIIPLPPGPPVITQGTEFTATLKLPFHLMCHIESVVPFTALWYKGDIQISPEKEFPKTAEFYYHIDNITLSSAGSYTCQANNSFGTVSQRINLLVKASAPVVKTPDSIEIEVNKTAEIPCQIESDLNYTVNWTKRDKTGLMHIIHGEKFTIGSSGTLLISSAQRSDEGLYQCLAQSNSGKDESNTLVKVLKPIHILVISAKTSFRVNEKVQLICSATGSPPITLLWKKYNVILQKSDPRVREYNETNIVLSITEGQKSDEGLYECVGKNNFSSDTGSIELKYLESPTIKMNVPLEPSLAETKYMLQCFAMGSPKPTISWTKDGDELFSGKTEQILNNGSLVFQRLEFKHTGEYKCIAESEAGSSDAKTYIHVGSVPKFAKEEEEINIKPLQWASLPCNVTGHPAPSIILSREDGKAMSTRFSSKQPCTIHLRAAHPDDEGIYLITAKNKFGNSTKRLKINIFGIEKPVLTPSKSEEVATVGKSKELTCLIQQGNPPPTVEWYKNGTILKKKNLLRLNGQVFANKSLIFRYVTPGHEGMYECKVSNLGGHATKIVKLTVQNVPYFTSIMHTVIKVRGGDPAVLSCEALGNPKPSVTWRKDGRRFLGTLPRTLLKNNSLHISSTVLENNGTYECTATNSAGEKKKIIELLVQFSPPLVEAPKEVKLQYKEKGKIPCQIESKLNYTVMWTKEEKSGLKNITTGKKFAIEHTGSLLFSHVEKSDEGVYQCAAQSIIGKSEVNIIVNITEPVHVIATSHTKKFKMHDHISLFCNATGSLPISLQWKKNGIILQQSDPRLNKSTENELILRIDDGQFSDEGIYKCEAQNELNTDSGSVNLQYLELPTINMKIPLSPALLEANYSLQCFATGRPKPSISWKKDDIKLTSDEQVQILNNGTLLINRVTLDRTGHYKCIAENEAGKAEAEQILEVGSIPRFDRENEEVDIEISKNGSVPCKVHGHPSPTVVWSRVGGPEMSERFSTGSSCSLQLRVANPEDEGIYIVNATNKFGSKMKQFRIHITGIEKPILKQGESEETSIFGKQKELTCSLLKGNPLPKFIWYKNGEKLDSKDLSSLGGNVFENGSLFFRYINFDNEGSYECDVSNFGGETRRRVYLKVYAIPRCTDPRNIIKVTRYNAVDLPCMAYGVPKPTVKWIKNGKLLSPSLFNVTGGNLFIANSTSENNGTYECILINKAGSQKKILELLVQYPPTTSAKIKYFEVKKDEKIILNCEVDAFPFAKVTWLKGDVVFNGESVVYSENNSSIRLTANISTSGKYKCIARNEEGIDSTEIEVIVTVAPSFEREEVNVPYSKGDNVTLSCETEGLPPPDYYWWKYNGIEPALDKSEITFLNVDESFAGLYICNAANIAGSSRKVFITIQYVAPKITTTLPKDETLKKGSFYSIICDAVGKPRPLIYWLKNGKPITHNNNTLTIYNAMPNDSGVYTCVAGNYEGSHEKNVVITIVEPPQMEPGYSSMPELEVREHEKIIISCPIMSDPSISHIEWTKDWKAIKRQKRIFPTKKGQSLKIKKINLADAGTYRCNVSNSAGWIQAEMQVRVLQAPTFLNEPITNKIQKIYVLLGDKIEINCTHDGNPIPKIYWYKNNHALAPLIIPHANIINKNSVIRIPQSRRTDEGEYKCVVENKAGHKEKTFEVQLFDYEIKPIGNWLPWSAWSACTGECGRSEKMRIRICNKGDYQCSGESEQWKPCDKICKVDGGWGTWTPWSDCSATCGTGERNQQRYCNNPKPKNGGKICYGSKTKYEKCNTNPCPVDGSWSTWSSWQPCAGPCPQGTTKRRRICTQPIPAFGGKSCPDKKVDVKPCSRMKCPVNGEWSKWGSWSVCSATCGLSTKVRRRSCNKPEPSFDGAPCLGNATQMRKCEIEPCDHIPLLTSIQFNGTLNGKPIPAMTIQADITDMAQERLVVAKTALNIFRRMKDPGGWYPYLSFLVSPVIWLTAFQRDKAENGYTLTKGIFRMQTLVKFEKGLDNDREREITINYEGHGVVDKKLIVEVVVQGEAPFFKHFLASVKMEPYEEEYVLVSPGELYASSRNVLKSHTMLFQYSTRTSVTYNPAMGKPVGLVQTLNRRVTATKRMKHSEEGFISTKHDTTCPRGFKLSVHGYCQDIDECADRQMNDCSLTQTCVNVKGSYECRCPAGFEPSETGECTDVNECTTGLHNCSDHCENKEGSYKCFCPPKKVLLDSKTKCSLLPVDYSTCIPTQIEVDGICKDRDPCNSSLACKEDETCLHLSGEVTCFPVICSSDYKRVKKSCIKFCNISTCESGATISEMITPLDLKLNGPIIRNRNLTSLKTPFHNNKSHLEHTYYRIIENEKGKPLKVKVMNHLGIIYAAAHLSTGRKYRISILASTYDESDATILYNNKFIVTFHVEE